MRLAKFWQQFGQAPHVPTVLLVAQRGEQSLPERLPPVGPRSHGGQCPLPWPAVSFPLLGQAGRGRHPSAGRLAARHSAQACPAAGRSALGQAPTAQPPGTLGRCAAPLADLPTDDVHALLGQAAETRLRAKAGGTGRRGCADRLAAGALGGIVHRAGLQAKQLAHAAPGRTAARTWPSASCQGTCGRFMDCARPTGPSADWPWPRAGCRDPTLSPGWTTGFARQKPGRPRRRHY